jgi:hypothetical protein
MADQERELLRPEDASSFEEFQARSIIEQAQCRGSTGTWKNIGLSALSGLLALVAILTWYGFATEPDVGRWGMLVIALISSGLLIWAFGGVMRTGVRGSRRYYQLDRLRKQWQARAERGEIPQTSPGGPKVWSDEDGTVQT